MTALCGSCRVAVVGRLDTDDERAAGLESYVDDTHNCPDCAEPWNAWRIAISAGNAKAALLARDLLVMRGASPRELHARLARLDDVESARLASMRGLSLP